MQTHRLFSVDLPGTSRGRSVAGLVFVNALEVDQLPEAEIQISGPLRLDQRSGMGGYNWRIAYIYIIAICNDSM